MLPSKREAMSKATNMKMICYSHANKTHFHHKCFAVSFVLKVEFLELGNGLLAADKSYTPSGVESGASLVTRLNACDLISTTSFLLVFLPDDVLSSMQ